MRPVFLKADITARSRYLQLMRICSEWSVRQRSECRARRMREICGAVSAMAMLAGLKEGNDDPENEEAKAHIYALVRDMSAKFKEKEGTLICRELLGIDGMEESAKPTVRTPEFYATRPCARLIAEAAEIIEEVLLDKKSEQNR